MSVTDLPERTRPPAKASATANAPIDDAEARRLALSRELEQLANSAESARAKQARQEVEKGAMPLADTLPLAEEDGRLVRTPSLLAKAPIFSAGEPPVIETELKENTADGELLRVGETIISKDGTKLVLAPAKKGHVLETKQAIVTRYGPWLSIADEDVYMAVLKRIWDNRLAAVNKVATGKLRVLPTVPADAGSIDEALLEQIMSGAQFYTMSATYYSIAIYLATMRAATGRATIGGAHSNDIKERLERMARVTLKIWNRRRNRFAFTNLLYLAGDEDPDGRTCDTGEFTVYLPASMITLTRHYYLQDMRVRAQLSRLGKAAYRVVAAHATTEKAPFDMELDILQEYTGTISRLAAFKSGLRTGFCKPLLALGWASRAEVVGTGRKDPFRLIVVPAKKPTR